MATVLTAQLAQIAAKSTNPLDLKAQKRAHSKSLLFDQNVAASQDFDTIYQICIEGYQELCQMDKRFINFARSIFSEQSKTQERSQMTDAQNKELDEVLESFLSLVGARLLLRPALKAVEWLVRRFRVHEHNILCLTLTFLPYHTMPIFATLLSIFPENIPPPLKFLHPYIKSFACPPRHTIVYTAIHNQTFFSALNSYMMKASSAGHHYAAFVSCWATIMTEAVAGLIDESLSGRREIQRKKEEDILLRILPFLNEGLAKREVPDLRVGCYMILTVVASKLALSEKVLLAMMEAVVMNWTPNTTHAGLICLVVLSQRRQNVHLPKKILKAVMSIQGIENDLSVLSEQYRVDKFVIGLVLGTLDRIQEVDLYRLTFVRMAIEGRFMSNTHIVLAIRAIVAAAKNSEAAPEGDQDLQGQLADLILRLMDSEIVGSLVQDTIRETKTDMESLEAKLQMVLVPKDKQQDQTTEDIEMDEVTEEPQLQTLESISHHIPTRTAYEISLLSHSQSYVYGSLSKAFLLASSSPFELEKFSDLPVLRKTLALSEPLFFSFFIRYWCGPHSAGSRASAIMSVQNYLSVQNVTADLQMLFPYIIYALADPSIKVRHAASELSLKLASTYLELGDDKKEFVGPILGSDNIYGSGSETKGVSWLSIADASRFVREILIPNLEEIRQDENHVARLLVDSLDGPHQSKGLQTPAKGLRNSTKGAILVSVGSHIVYTPIYRVKFRLLSMLNRISKVGGVSKSKTLLPLLLAQEKENEKSVTDHCEAEDIDKSRFFGEVVKIVAPNDRDGIRILQRIIALDDSLPPVSLQRAAVHQVRNLWPSTKPDAQVSFAETLLALTLTESTVGQADDIQGDALEVLRVVPVSANTLHHLLGTIPALPAMSGDGPAQTKRRRTSNGHVQSHDDRPSEGMQHALRHITIVLELVEASKNATNSVLTRELFQVLMNLQHSKVQLGIELGYLQSLVLRSLYRIVEQSKATADIQLDRSAVRPDVIVECFRTASNTQVQQAALMLMSSLATVIPELIIHSVMPVFTFMSTGLLRQSDDYSAHIIDQTIESIIPPLVEALRKQKGGPLAGASGLLLSFVAAFEHIPNHRRNGLFSSLIDKLGPEEFLFALLVLLLDRYGDSREINQFIQAFTSQYSPLIQLKTMEKYLEVVLDSLKPKPTVSSHFLTFGDGRTRTSTAMNLLSLPPNIFRAPRLISRSARLLSDKSDDVVQLRQIYSNLVEATLLLAEQVRPYTKLPSACDLMLDALLGLLSLGESINSLEILLKRGNTNVQRQVLRSLEHRIGTESAGNHAAQEACINFLAELSFILESSSDLLLLHSATSCIDRIIERYGKKDVEAVWAVMKVVASNMCLGADDSRLRIMALLCLSTSVEVLGEAIILIIPHALPKAMDHLEAILGGEDVDSSMHNAAYSFLGSLLLYIPWIMTGPYLDRALKTSHESANAGLPADCNVARKEVLNLIAKQAGPQECFGALLRTWDSAMVEGPDAVSEHLEILQLTIERQPKSVIAKHSQSLLNLFLKVFDLRRIQCSPRTTDSYDNEEMDEVEKISDDVAIKMIYKLNDAIFRPLFVKILEWATTPTGTKEKQGKIFRQISWYTFLHAFFNTLKSIVTNYASFIIEDAVKVLNTISTNDPDSVTLWSRVIAALTSSFEHDQDEFWQAPSHFAAIFPPLLAQLSHGALHKDSPDLIPCITALAVAADSPDHHKSLNAAILAHMRSDNAAVRLAAVQCEMSLTGKLGEEWLSLLPEMLPFISELQEDDDERVEREVGTWILQIEGILGESLDSMLL
ncbi:snoRNA-binding rRNA-processing protein utp10 [Xylographa opegraphella]|nr:snoRNA-binding rRNA-processing protein utp10 [Xylographa opegraphella]